MTNSYKNPKVLYNDSIEFLYYKAKCKHSLYVGQF